MILIYCKCTRVWNDDNILLFFLVDCQLFMYESFNDIVLCCYFVSKSLVLETFFFVGVLVEGSLLTFSVKNINILVQSFL